MKKQTAVEWLIQNIVADQTIRAKSMSEWTMVYEQAKAMEKGQLMDAFLKVHMVATAEQYYNETYK